MSVLSFFSIKPIILAVLAILKHEKISRIFDGSARDCEGVSHYSVFSGPVA